MLTRCPWAETHPLLQAYHDVEWGVRTDDRYRLFEFLVLEGAQAGLSWITVLKRRTAYRQAWADFRPEVVATWNEDRVTDLLHEPGLIKNQAKIRSVLINARAFLCVEEEFGSFKRYLTHLVGTDAIVHHYHSSTEIPAYDQTATQLSRDLHQRGFQFVGPTICYSYLQAVGVMMDHLVGCFRYDELAQASVN
ncbi:MAG: DNA-3-methyladenine glycosylase I [Sulfobacillus acidophilus]|uniref:DNA-3-methyladenine glycosylase I n=1 Tax=Sulfobacillus acidophilus TaxID=53633 RepID=A0A2T2WHN2_9FIRM|nr:MAG: DNA-3-methyladenine glycosylase I [Sulfobacillus acidophilus]